MPPPPWPASHPSPPSLPNISTCHAKVSQYFDYNYYYYKFIQVAGDVSRGWTADIRFRRRLADPGLPLLGPRLSLLLSQPLFATQRRQRRRRHGDCFASARGVWGGGEGAPQIFLYRCSELHKENPGLPIRGGGYRCANIHIG